MPSLGGRFPDTMTVTRWQDIPRDPGLEPTRLVNERGPYVGTTPRRPIRRFAREARLDALLLELYRGFGPQQWWPAETPFEVVVGAVLTQNTAWTNAERAIASLKKEQVLTPAAILSVSTEALERAIRSSGYFRAKARKLVHVSRWYLAAGGLTGLRTRPLAELRRELLGVWGVGAETADSILCYAAGRRTVVVDAYTRRILSRHDFLDEEADYEEVRAWLSDRLVASQAVYEEFHALCVRTGYDGCKPTPRCERCPATPPVAASTVPGTNPPLSPPRPEPA